MELHEALAQISEIRTQIARTETFRGYRSVTVAATGLLALAAAAVQAVWIPAPEEQMPAYLTLWIGAALLALITTGVEMHLRNRRTGSSMARRLTRLAIEQFVPCLLAGALLTYVFVLFIRESLWMLPGLWAMLFGLGIFSSWRLLTRPIFWVAAYYLIAGALSLVFARGPAAFSPWAMAGTFGVGQLMAALILYLTLERHDARH